MDRRIKEEEIEKGGCRKVGKIFSDLNQKLERIITLLKQTHEKKPFWRKINCLHY